MPPPAQPETPRLVFANQLRGIAALRVMFTHLIGVLWIERDLVSRVTSTPILAGDPPAALLGLFTHRYLNFSPLGLALFFLISGMVMPVSLARRSRASFILARLLRIHPTHAAALLLQVGVVFAAARQWGVPFQHSAHAILSNALLIQDVTGTPGIDLVSWSLVVELKFYVLMAFLAPLVLRGSVVALFAVAGALFLGDLVLPHTSLPITTGSDSVFLVFMLAGVLFNYRWRGLVGPRVFYAYAAAMMAMFLACWWFSVLWFQFWVVPANYFYTLAIFEAAYRLRARFRPVPVLDALAKISFPLYVLHFVLGFSILKLLMLRFGLDYLPALGVTLPVLLGLAALFHVAVEARTIAMGRALARRQGVGPGGTDPGTTTNEGAATRAQSRGLENRSLPGSAGPARPQPGHA